MAFIRIEQLLTAFSSNHLSPTADNFNFKYVTINENGFFGFVLIDIGSDDFCDSAAGLACEFSQCEFLTDSIFKIRTFVDLT